MTFPDWPRPHYRPGGGDALVFYMLFGPLGESLSIDGKAYRTAGMPAGMALDEYDIESQPAPFELISEPEFAEALRALDLSTVDTVQAARQCVLLHGTVADPPSLNYLRDAVGIVQYLLDVGCAAVLDVQTITWHTPDTWRKRIFDVARPSPADHAVILRSEDTERADCLWYHTRGMRKFGRPDISLRAVPRAKMDSAEELCNRLIEFQALGGTVEETREVTMPGIPQGRQFRITGDHEDPHFNNVRIELWWD